MKAQAQGVVSIFVASLLGSALMGCGSGETARSDAGAVMDASIRSDARTVDARIDMADGGESDATLDAERADSGGEAVDGGPACTADLECDDGIACTEDTCDAASRSCTHLAVDGSCDDALDCTRDTCDRTIGCVFAPDDLRCQAMFCSGVGAVCDPGAGCVGGAARDCGDGDPCTFDSCEESIRSCENAIGDLDGDGSPDAVMDALACTSPLDCDASNPAVFPGAAELCNGADEDCDSLIDETFACSVGSGGSCTTSCGTAGTRTCGATCTWSACIPPAETCNGRDDNCDGAADDGFACIGSSGGSCMSACGSPGTRICAASTCTWGTCLPPGEICNGLDDDCDAVADETFACARGAAGACTSSCGTAGSRLCGATCAWGACAPPTELCNGMDDDCDGLLDETFTCARGAAGACTSSCGSTGSRLCGATCAWGACAPPAETCNGRDDNCDGIADDGFACVAGSGGSCMSACASTGTRVCDASSCTWGTCLPPGETCNGLDDDCDGLSDETFTCARGAAGACTSSCGTMGSRTCGATCAWGACTPPVEVCNGVDDDCDAVADDGFTCSRGSTRSCIATCGTTGRQTCSASCAAWGACVPPVELCDGSDNDCDGVRDNGFSCVRSTTGPCTTTCGTTGTRSCGSSCAWSGCAAPPETCNGVDDDCDGVVDNGTDCGLGLVCSSGACRSIPGSCTGYRYAGHAYAICTTDVTWASASSTCSAYGGHLVTVTSGGEQSFLAGLIAGRSWSGLYRGSSCTWQWVTGEPVTYTAWDPGQPSSACGDQDCGVLWYGPGWPWDDYWCARSTRYACEWES